MLAGTLADQSSFEAEPLDEDCSICGAPVVIDYDHGAMVERCTSCDGIMGNGVLFHTDEYPPAGLVGRSPQEARLAAYTFMECRKQSMDENVCPNCAGTVTTSLYVCEDHHAEPGPPDRCGHLGESQTLLVYDVCKAYWHITPTWFAHGTPVVQEFVTDHKIDPHFIAGNDLLDTEDVEVVSAEPPEVRVVFEVDGDRLEVTFDEAARVVEVTEQRE